MSCYIAFALGAVCRRNSDSGAFGLSPDGRGCKSLRRLQSDIDIIFVCVSIDPLSGDNSKSSSSKWASTEAKESSVTRAFLLQYDHLLPQRIDINKFPLYNASVESEACIHQKSRRKAAFLFTPCRTPHLPPLLLLTPQLPQPTSQSQRLPAPRRRYSLQMMRQVFYHSHRVVCQVCRLWLL